ncbi:MAG: hypothetical protein LC793_15730 [Thermomicrobia bacterium]|nr:hypothetical protein [Thermomicrobia bacterium]MCA1723868.1 hypothetical protein [Thermomicrobia bacterium]
MSPSVLLTLLIAGMLGLLAHATLGRFLWQLPVYLVAAAAGTFAGEVAATLAGGGWLRYGTLPVGSALVGGLGAILLAWLVTFRAMTRAEAGD